MWLNHTMMMMVNKKKSTTRWYTQLNHAKTCRQLGLFHTLLTNVNSRTLLHFPSRCQYIARMRTLRARAHTQFFFVDTLFWLPYKMICYLAVSKLELQLTNQNDDVNITSLFCILSCVIKRVAFNCTLASLLLCSRYRLYVFQLARAKRELIWKWYQIVWHTKCCRSS